MHPKKKTIQGVKNLLESNEDPQTMLALEVIYLEHGT